MQLDATLTYSDSTAADVTATASWSPSDSGVATVVGGLVSGVAEGAATVTATSSGLSIDVPVAVTEPVGD